MKNFVIRFGGAELRKSHTPQQKLAITARELVRAGLPPRKVRRVMGELQRLADADPALNGRTTLLRLARGLAGVYL